jgi:hypothetical protein
MLAKFYKSSQGFVMAASMCLGLGLGMLTNAQTANDAGRKPPMLTPEMALEVFDQIWGAFDQKYAMFGIRPEVDWAMLREQYRPKALACRSPVELARVCADMLKHLRDLQVWVTVAKASVPVFDRPQPSNANPNACQAILGGFKEQGRVAWAVTTNRIGFLAIRHWDDARIPMQCDEALEQMRATRGLIVDVRLNPGGDEPLAQRVAARFVEREFVYGYDQFRNGPNHADLTQKLERSIAPRGPWRYNRPVILLIGQKCAGSAESFIGMMTGDPQVTTMGDHSCGLSGYPETIHLPFDMTVSVPKWIDYLPDGTLLEDRGFQPQVPFKPGPGAFQGDRDDLLAAALARLSKAPLPRTPIEGPALERFTKTGPPEIVSLNPPNGASGVSPAVTELSVTFNVPMSASFSWCGGGPNYPAIPAGKRPYWTDGGKTCVLPVRLKPGCQYELGLNSPSFKGFKSDGGVPLAPVVYSFKTSDGP